MGNFGDCKMRDTPFSENEIAKFQLMKSRNKAGNPKWYKPPTLPKQFVFKRGLPPQVPPQAKCTVQTKPPTVLVHCNGGPFHNEVLELIAENGDPETIEFLYKGEKGRYLANTARTINGNRIAEWCPPRGVWAAERAAIAAQERKETMQRLKADKPQGQPARPAALVAGAQDDAGAELWRQHAQGLARQQAAERAQEAAQAAQGDALAQGAERARKAAQERAQAQAERRAARTAAAQAATQAATQGEPFNTGKFWAAWDKFNTERCRAEAAQARAQGGPQEAAPPAQVPEAPALAQEPAQEAPGAALVPTLAQEPPPQAARPERAALWAARAAELAAELAEMGELDALAAELAEPAPPPPPPRWRPPGASAPSWRH